MTETFCLPVQFELGDVIVHKDKYGIDICVIIQIIPASESADGRKWYFRRVITDSCRWRTKMGNSGFFVDRSIYHFECYKYPFLVNLEFLTMFGLKVRFEDMDDKDKALVKTRQIHKYMNRS